MKVIGLVGYARAGKTSVARYLESRGFHRITLSDLLREEASRRGMQDDRPTLQRLGDELRQSRGGGYLIAIALSRAEAARAACVVIDGVRNPDEIAAIKAHPSAVILAVDRPGELAKDAAALRERAPSEPPWGQRVAESLGHADITIRNDRGLEDLYAAVDRELTRK